MLKLSGIWAGAGTSTELEIRADERPYPAWSGYGADQTMPPERGSVYDLILAAARANLRPHAVVADGDSLATYLDAFDRVNEQISIADRRFVLIHAGFADAAQQERIKRLGIVLTIHAGHLWRVGRSRTEGVSADRLGTYVPLRSYVENGVPFVLATDNVPINPLRAIWAAVARQDEATGEVIAPEQRITREDALRAMTTSGAFLSFDEDERGSIEVGKLADLVVLDKDLLTVRENEIKDIEVAMTIVGGRVVYQNGLE